MKHAILLAVIPLALGACSKQRQAEDVVREQLRDPDSAKFGAFYFNEKTQKGCLTVNAKNSMGGYSGDQQAYVEKTDKGWEGAGIAEIPPEVCRQIHADLVD